MPDFFREAQVAKATEAYMRWYEELAGQATHPLLQSNIYRNSLRHGRT